MLMLVNNYCLLLKLDGDYFTLALRNSSTSFRGNWSIPSLKVTARSRSSLTSCQDASAAALPACMLLFHGTVSLMRLLAPLVKRDKTLSYLAKAAELTENLQDKEIKMSRYE